VSAAVVIAVLLSKNIIKMGGGSTSPATTSGSSGSSAGNGSGGTPTKTVGAPTSSVTPQPVKCATAKDIPSDLKGTFMDITTWKDMSGFNCTFTNEKVGDLPLLGLNVTWDDRARANPNVPPLSESWGSYASRPIRGVNLGGWLSLEPFITPSIFDAAGKAADEWSLCATLGPQKCAEVLENHYATFITEKDFKDIADAGLDHIRIPFSYWAVEVLEGDKYLLGVSWRFLLRGIEWARKYGLRVKLDLHGLPGSQNGWNHSGRSSKINWISGPDGAVNAQRSLAIHDKLSKFFAQDRYKNVIAFYGLANEPARAIEMGPLVEWTAAAYKIVRDNGVQATQVFSEAIRGLGPWQGQLTGYGDSLVIDAHEYTIFDNGLIGLKHAARVEFACKTFTDHMVRSMDTSSGFGPTMVGEWSQADTDCTKYLNGVGTGARWDGTFSDAGGVPRCPAGDESCSCELANAAPSAFSADYKLFLLTWAVAQMDAYEKGWGWFYWTWKTESAPLWSYQAGWTNGFMPAKAYQRDWDCSKPIPSFGSLSEGY
jgi:glucan 1,3-beta-glucosidase